MSQKPARKFGLDSAIERAVFAAVCTGCSSPAPIGPARSGWPTTPSPAPPAYSCEALELADRVVLMNNAVVEQVGTPEDVYTHPASPFAYEFLGQVNRFKAVAYVRPHDVEIFNGMVMSGIPATVRYISAAGPLAKIEVEADDGRFIEVELSRPALHALNLKVGRPIYIRARKARVFITDRHSNAGEAFSIRGEGAYGEALAQAGIRPTGTA